MTHAKLSPSSAHRWMRCPGSVLFGEQFEQKQTAAASDGTLAHEIAAARLREVLKGERSLPDPSIPEDWAAPIADYVDYCTKLAEGAHFFGIEERISIWPFTGEEGAGGTCDFFTLARDALHVVDLKFGEGEIVHAKGADGGINPQLGLYALGVSRDFCIDSIWGVERVKLHIVQPRRDHVSVAELSLSDLERFAETVRAAAERVRERPYEYNPSPVACRWCPGRAHCSARALEEVKHLGADVNTMTSAELGFYLWRVADLRRWCDDIESRAMRELAERRTVPGWKLVEGRGARRWSPNAEPLLVGALGDEAYRVEKRLITVAEAEKRLGKKSEILAAATVREPGAPKLAPESDPRPPLLLDAASEFRVEQTQSNGDDNGR